MADIHNQTGGVEKPLATLGEEIGDEGQAVLKQAVEAASSSSLSRGWATMPRSWMAATIFLGGLFGYALVSRLLCRRA